MPNAYELAQERSRAYQTIDTIDHYVSQSFNLDAFGEALQKSTDPSLDFEAYERELPFVRLAAFKATLYQNKYGTSPSSLEQLDVTGAERTYDKREDMHLPGKNYKIHGARFAVLHTLDKQPEARIMTTASAGNHGISLAAAVNQVNAQLNRSLHREAHIYCREDISPAKKERLEDLGAQIFPHYETLEDAMEAAQRISERDANHVLIHPFDDPLTMAGQATIEFETFAQLKSMGVDLPNTAFHRYIPVGGGGYLAGTAYAWSKLRGWGLINDRSKLIGVEVENNDSVYRALNDLPSLQPGSVHAPCGPNTLDTDSDGTATLRAGHNTLPVIREHVSALRVIPKEYLIRACGQLANSHRGRAPELAGALSLGGLLYDIDQREGANSTVCHLTTTTGSNITSELLRQLSTEWLDADCDIRTKVAALALRRASEGLSAPTIYDPRITSSNKGGRQAPESSSMLRVWKGHVQR